MKLSTVVLAALTALAVADEYKSVSCDVDNHCPEDKPCCSQYGECGTGAYCLGGCDPKSSFELKSCMPMPVCKKRQSKFTSMDRIAKNTEYLGDAENYDWVYTGNLIQQNNGLLLTMPKNSVGTVLSSTDYMWYGKVSATFKSSHLQGVVSAFILFSDVKDEIDYEFVGADTNTVQTNYYWQGVLDWTHGRNISVDNTHENFFTYSIDWTPDQITWAVDDQPGRVLKKSDTWNETSKSYMYPQTPSRIQLSLWPAGQASNAEGTIAWAGGEIDWDAEDIQKYGYYYATVTEIDVDCYEPPASAKKSGDKSYRYTDLNAMESDVEITGDDTKLASFDATGADPEKDDGSKNGTAPTGMLQHPDSDPNIANVTGGVAVSTKKKTSSVPSSTESLEDVSGSAIKKSTSSKESTSSEADPTEVVSGERVSSKQTGSASAGDDNGGNGGSAAATGSSSRNPQGNAATASNTGNGGFQQFGQASGSAAEKANTAGSNGMSSLLLAGALAAASLLM